MKRPHAATGFTLTELLVVMAILVSLFGLVLTGARTSRRSDGDIRRGAQQLASLLLATQSLSLGSPTGAAVIIDSEGTLSRTISQARRYPYIEGRVEAGMPPDDPTAWQQYVQLTPENDTAESLVHGYRIRFLERDATTQGPPSDWFAYTCTAPPVALVQFRLDNGQTPHNAVWPTAPESGDSLAFQIARYPIPNGLATKLPESVAIDLRFSGYGDETLAGWGRLDERGAIGVGFDTVGAVDALMQNVLPEDGQQRTVQPLTPNERLFFFVTARADITDSTVNPLANEDALWVVVHPRNGTVTISENVPQQTDDTTALRAAREKARRGLTIGG